MQTVFEKVWILDGGVAGVELTEPFAELLTVEARLALTETPSDGPNTPEEVKTYHRCARGLSGLLAGRWRGWSLSGRTARYL